jgi:proteasome alpha subunit
VSEEKIGTNHIRLAVIDSASKTLKMISEDEIERYSKEIPQKETS